MEDILRLIERNPYLIFVGIFVLFSLFRRKNRPEENQQKAKIAAARQRQLQEQRQSSARAAIQARTASPTSTNNDLLTALQNAYKTFEETAAPSTSNTRTLVLPSTAVLGGSEGQSLERAPAQPDVYDVRTNVYDDEAELERMDMAALPVPVHRGFGYHSAVEEPTSVEYHTNTFFGFQRAEGLHTTGPVAAEPAEIEVKPLIGGELDRTEMVRAIIFNEVLGPPLARRHRG